MKPFIYILFLCSFTRAQAQSFTPAELKDFRLRQDSLKKLAFKIVNDENAAVRFRSDSAFTKIMVRALLRKNSFQFPFDSLKNISRLYSQDSVFRIFTWQVVKDDSYCRQRGFIQMKTKDGSLKLFPLRDVSEFTSYPVDTIANHLGWIGAVYYRILIKEYEGKKMYTLFGYDENNTRTTRKWMDVLSFDDNGAPLFGLRNVFSYAKDSIPKPSVNRFLLEYKKDARARVQYDEEMDMIVYDHLVSESNEPQKKYTLIPDGDYEGFQWKNGQWLHIDKVFDFKLKDGEAPVPVPFIEDKLTAPKQDTKKPVAPVKKKPGGDE
ncbi:MAG: hypothetical protein K2X48_11365 [Chitinophagaceae bacterium]|nr:hypothetical protein [Chitinophagaceae bacterium]